MSFFKLPCHSLFVPIRPQPVFFLYFFVTLTECLTLPLCTGEKTSALHVLTPRRKLSVFQGKTDSVISHLISLFSLTTLLLPCTLSLPFHQDCLPGASGVHLCFTAWLQGQKHPPYFPSLTPLLEFNPSTPNHINERKNSRPVHGISLGDLVHK